MTTTTALSRRLPEGTVTFLLTDIEGSTAAWEADRAAVRDLGRPEQVFQACHPGLRRDFPALRSLDAVPNDLPVHLTSFVGRDAELAELGGLVGRHRRGDPLPDAGDHPPLRRLALTRAEETAAVRDAHLRFCLEAAARMEGVLVGPTPARIRRAAADQDNYRVALDWALAGDEIPVLRCRR